jgi:DNA-binding NarL/FixJ family response regulator
MKRITVLLAEDHTIVREGFRRMLELETDIEVVGEACNGRDAVKMTQQLRPDVVLMDIAMPQLNGLEATRQILEAQPRTKIIILSAHNDDAYIENAIHSGAKGFLLKQTSSHEVCAGIREIYLGRSYFSPPLPKRLSQLSGAASSLRKPAQKRVQLTSRESEVLQLIAEGNANKQTAAKLGIGMKTVEKHRQHLMEKLEIHDTAGLTRYAIAAGIIESSVQNTII